MAPAIEKAGEGVRVGEALSVSSSPQQNIVTLRSPDLLRLQYLPGSQKVTAGEPGLPTPKVDGGDGIWTVDVICGRRKTTPIAAAYSMLCGGQDYIFNPYARSDRVPRELNFFCGVKATFNAGGQPTDFDLFVGQGSNDDGNNWWIGGTPVANRGRAPVLIAVEGYDPELDELLTRQVYQIDFSDKDVIDFRPWI